MTPSEVGERTEAAVLTALVAAGKTVLLPFSGHQRYDLAYEEKGSLIKVQCKSGRERHGAIEFMTCSNGRKSRENYRGDADLFGVYCHERCEVYLVSVADVPTRAARLRLCDTRNGQRCGVRWADQYLLSRDGKLVGEVGASNPSLL